jgi:hypothetical protein
MDLELQLLWKTRKYLISTGTLNLEGFGEMSVNCWGHRGHDCMVAGFTNTCAITAYKL